MIDLQTFNSALLAKRYWYWSKPEMRLWKSAILITHEERPCNIPTCKFFQQSLRNLQGLMYANMKWSVGDGVFIQFWQHDWGLGILKDEFNVLFMEARDPYISLQEVLNIQDLVSMFNMVGSLTFITQLSELQTKLLTRPTTITINDAVSWRLTTTGEYTVQSAYKRMKDKPTVTTRIHRVWKMKVPPRIKVFAWLTYHGRILTIDNLVTRGWNLPNMCVMCRRAEETIKHLFSECNYTLQLYRKMNQVFSLPAWNWRFILAKEQAQFWIIHKTGERKTTELLLLAMFICWRERCSRIFTDKEKTITELLGEVKEQWDYLH